MVGQEALLERESDLVLALVETRALERLCAEAGERAHQLAVVIAPLARRIGVQDQDPEAPSRHPQRQLDCAVATRFWAQLGAVDVEDAHRLLDRDALHL